jgi:hypothetical protein
MHSIFRSSGLAWGVAFVGFALAAAGCSCGAGSMIVPVPITVSLPVSTVVVPQDGTQVVVPINITSTSETALVSVSGLPTGLQEKYAASDTNPSGLLTFTASAAAPAGIYTPTVTVKSAGQTASTNFTLVVSVAKTENTTGVFANDAGRPRWQETTLQRRPEVRHNRSHIESVPVALNLGRIILGSIFRQTANQLSTKKCRIASATSTSYK